MDVYMDISEFRGNGRLMCKVSASTGESISNIPENKPIFFNNFENGLITSILFYPGTLEMKVELTKKGKDLGMELKYKEVLGDNNKKTKQMHFNL